MFKSINIFLMFSLLLSIIYLCICVYFLYSKSMLWILYNFYHTSECLKSDKEMKKMQII